MSQMIRDIVCELQTLCCRTLIETAFDESCYLLFIFEEKARALIFLTEDIPTDLENRDNATLQPNSLLWYICTLSDLKSVSSKDFLIVFKPKPQCTEAAKEIPVVQRLGIYAVSISCDAVRYSTLRFLPVAISPLIPMIS